WVLTAHHADDQAETVLLQLLRGAGVAGLAAMPQCKAFGCGLLLRPLLGVSRQQLESVAKLLELQWIEDHSNADVRFDRNYLRHRVLPLLNERWPAAATALARSAAHAAEASELLQEVAARDIPLHGNTLSVSQLQSLSTQRQSNALRQWISSHGYTAPSTAKLQHLVKDLVLASNDARGCVAFGDTQIRRHTGYLYLGNHQSFAISDAFSHVWPSREQPLMIPETGQTLVADDLPLPWVPVDEPLMVRSRQGGEKIRLSTQPYRQAVKSLLQQQGLPPWQRCRLPFIWRGDELLGIVGVGFIAPPASSGAS
ncbi:MAG: tRNA lysidine(34) synthetase TilS, partial [Pseudomonadota bacterium]